jgi:hypothetical protein
MLSAALRNNARRVVSTARPTVARTAFRNSGARRAYASLEPTGQKTSYTLPIGIAAAVVAAGGLYYFTSEDADKKIATAGKEAKQIAKAATHFTPTKEDYQKVTLLVLNAYSVTHSYGQVYNSIAELIECDEAAEYDGMKIIYHCSEALSLTL